MGYADFADVGSSLSEASLARGVTAGITPPPGGGSFVYGYNSLDSDVVGAHGKYVDRPGFTPTGSGPATADGGGVIAGVLKRYASSNNTGFTPMLFFALQGSPPTVNDMAYMIALSNEDPYRIVLAKGVLAAGVPGDGEDMTVLRQSSEQFSMGDDLYHHVRLECIVQPNADVKLVVEGNDLTAHPLGTAPDWQPILGMDDFIDDRLQIATGSAPLLGGYCGFAFAVNRALNRRGAFDGIEAYRND